MTFKAYAGTRLIETQSRAVGGNASKSFRFIIGDPNLVGGITVIESRVCYMDVDYDYCGRVQTDNRNS